MYFDSPHPLFPTAGPHKLYTFTNHMTVKFRRNLWQYQKGKLYMYVIIITAMDIIISIKWGARVEKDLHVKVEKI